MNHHRELSSQRGAEPYSGSRDRLCLEPTVSTERQSRGHVSQRADGGSLEKPCMSNRKSDVPFRVPSSPGGRLVRSPQGQRPVPSQPLGKSLYEFARRLDGLSCSHTPPWDPRRPRSALLSRGSFTRVTFCESERTHRAPDSRSLGLLSPPSRPPQSPALFRCHYSFALNTSL